MSTYLQSAFRSPIAPMLFAAIPAELQDYLRSSARVLRFDSGQIISQRGDQPDGFWLIEEGSIAVGRHFAEGEFRAAAVLGPGDSWGELAMFAQQPRGVDAIARTHSLVRHINAPSFEAILQDHPSAMRLLLAALSAQCQELLDVSASMRSGNSKARIAAMLATMASARELPAAIAISQQELAELLGLSRMTINMTLRRFEGDGMIRRSYGTIEVIDRAAIELIALG